MQEMAEGFVGDRAVERIRGEKHGLDFVSDQGRNALRRLGGAERTAFAARREFPFPIRNLINRAVEDRSQPEGPLAGLREIGMHSTLEYPANLVDAVRGTTNRNKAPTAILSSEPNGPTGLDSRTVTVYNCAVCRPWPVAKSIE